jgi:hypothetical protein
MKKNSFLILGMLVMVLVLGLVFAGCATGTGGGGAADTLDETKWEGTAFSFDPVSEGGGPSDGTYTLTFNSPAFLIVREDGGNIVKGTYLVSGSDITFTTTQEYWSGGDVGWHDVNPDGYYPKTGMFTGATMTIVCGGDSSLDYAKK